VTLRALGLTCSVR